MYVFKCKTEKLAKMMNFGKICITLLSLTHVMLELMAQRNSDSEFNLKFQQDDYKIKFEWTEVIRVNRAAVNQFEIHVFKYNRTTTALNVTYNYKIDVGNDLIVVIQVYKFYSNEYRLFPIRFQVKLCEGLSKNLVGSGTMFNCGNFKGCPIIKNQRIHICNWVPDEKQFPPFVPTGKYMIEIQGLYRSQETWLVNFYGSIIRPIVGNVWGN